MTPETARALEPGTTPGPWEWREHRSRSSARHFDSLGPQGENHALETQDAEGYASWLVASDEDKALIAAVPDMRATIAAQTWEWGVEDAYGDTAWMVCDHYEGTQDSETEAREYLSTFGPDSVARLVRRPVGPVEVVE